jgi:hypothetical protein
LAARRWRCPRCPDCGHRHRFHCDLLACIGRVKGKTIALIRHPAALEEDCRTADIVVAPFTIGRGCRVARVVVDRHLLWSEGAQALYIEGLSIRTMSVAEARGQRPWAPDRPLVKRPGQGSGEVYARGKNEPGGRPSRFDGDPDE